MFKKIIEVLKGKEELEKLRINNVVMLLRRMRRKHIGNKELVAEINTILIELKSIREKD